MRFHVGPIPDEFEPDSSWRPMREPDPILMQVIAVPLGAAAGALVAYGWYLVGLPPGRFSSHQAVLIWIFALLTFPLLILVHELLHAVVHPRFGLTEETIIGFWPRRLLCYACYSGSISRDRFLAVFAMPTLVITVLPLVAAALGLLTPNLKWVAAWFSILNAFCACGDYLGIGLILAQLPRAAIVRNKGWQTYWKRSDTPSSP